MTWVVVQKQAHDLVVSTYGRGFYIMDDITPLEQGVMESAVHARRCWWRRALPFATRAGHGASSASGWPSVPKAPVQLEVLDAKGALVREACRDVTGHAGLNRVAWDMHYEPPRLVALRTTPPENPHIWEEPRFQNEDTRADHALGPGAGRSRPHRGARALTRCG